MIHLLKVGNLTPLFALDVLDPLVEDSLLSLLVLVDLKRVRSVEKELQNQCLCDLSTNC